MKEPTLLSPGQARSAAALAHNVAALCERYGVERVLFVTLTFSEHILDVREAQRRFNSFETGALREKFPIARIGVVERQKSGRVHFHLLVVGVEDYRTGFDWDQVARGIYSSANPSLRAIWAWFRKTCPAYGFGRSEAMPIKSTGGAIARYVGKYIGKHIHKRKPEDKGARLVRYGGEARKMSAHFAWNSPGARAWRWAVARLAADNGILPADTYFDPWDDKWKSDGSPIADAFGPGWAFKLAKPINMAYLEAGVPAPMPGHLKVEVDKFSGRLDLSLSPPVVGVPVRVERGPREF